MEEITDVTIERKFDNFGLSGQERERNSSGMAKNNIVGGRIAQNEKKIAGEQLDRKHFIKKEETVHFLSIYLHKNRNDTRRKMRRRSAGTHILRPLNGLPFLLKNLYVQGLSLGVPSYELKG